MPDKKNDACVILGNGPSLSISIEESLAFLQGKSKIAVNSFATSNYYVLLKPNYYVLLDADWWENSEQDTISQTILALEDKTDWNLQLLIPYQAKGKGKLAEIRNPKIHISFFNYTVYSGFEWIGDYLYRKNLAMPQCQNVLVASIFLAINIGFKNNYLLGADHSWHNNLAVNNNNVLCFKDVHFYENEKSISYTPFTKDLSTSKTFTTEEIFAILAKVFRGYFAVNTYAEKRSVTIFNATPDSYIDAFKRIKIPK